MRIRPRLKRALTQEQSVFRVFSSRRRISRHCTAFACPGIDEVPHWNTVYPTHASHIYSPGELRDIRRFYGALGVTPHIMTFDAMWADQSAETSEYFYVDQELSADQTGLAIDQFSSIPDTDLGTFCAIIQRAFQLNDPTTAYFREQMAKLAMEEGSKFWIVSFDGARCGCTSTFKTVDGSDFMFNFAILPEFQGQGLGARMLNYIFRAVNRPLYTYSDNPVMRNTLLPNAGFSTLGVVHIVALATYLAKTTE